MGFKRFVEVGRVVFINYGEEAGKPAVITDILDQSRVLLSNPHPKHNIPVQVMALKRVDLTDFKVEIPRAIGFNALKKKLVALDNTEQKLFADGGKWENGIWQRKVSMRSKRANLTDFDRFKLMVTKKQRRFIVYREVKKIKKSAVAAK